MQQRKRKLKTKEDNSPTEIVGNDFIVSHLSNMHWKY